MKLTNKVALVTGAASGLGLGIADCFAHEGATVVLVDRDAARGEAAANQLRSEGLSAHFIAANLARPDDITRMVQAATALTGRLDIVVNNAATFLPKTIDQISVEEWDLLMAVNLRAPFLVVQAALPALKATEGTVLNISSTAALRVFSPNLPYNTAKAGVITMTQSMAQELWPYRIRVNCICPGAVDTPALINDIKARGGSDEDYARVQASGYLVSPRQLAATALYLVSDDAFAVNGSTVVADAGAMFA